MKLLVFLLLSFPAFADSYRITILGSDSGRYFAGIDDAGTVTFNGWGETGTSPNDDQGSPCPSLVPANALFSVCNNGRVVFTGLETQDEDFPGIYVNNVKIYARGGSALYMNAVGDVVFDDGSLDDWIEAIDTPTQVRFLLADPPAVAELPSIDMLGLGLIVLLMGKCYQMRGEFQQERQQAGKISDASNLRNLGVSGQGISQKTDNCHKQT